MPVEASVHPRHPELQMLSDPDLLSLKPRVIVHSPSSLFLLAWVWKMRQMVTWLYLTKLVQKLGRLHRFQQFLIRKMEGTYFPWHSKPQPLKSVQFNFLESARSPGLSKRISLNHCCLFFSLGTVFGISFSKLHLRKIIETVIYCNYYIEIIRLLIWTSSNTIHTELSSFWALLSSCFFLMQRRLYSFLTALTKLSAATFCHQLSSARKCCVVCS